MTRLRTLASFLLDWLAGRLADPKPIVFDTDGASERNEAAEAASVTYGPSHPYSKGRL